MSLRLRQLVITLALVVCMPSAAYADATDPRADDLSRQLLSPFCPGKTLDVCTSANAAGWRADIRDWVAEGVPSDEIQRRLEERAGRPLSAVPSAEQAAWMPTLTVLFGALCLFAGWRRIRKRLDRPREEVVDHQTSAEDDAWDEQLDFELSRMS